MVTPPQALAGGVLGQALLVGVGGFVGSAARFLVSDFVRRLQPQSTFPYGTLAVNVIGCFAIGLLGGWAESRGWFGPTQRLLVLVGVLGGFTTFSTFAWDTLALSQQLQLGRAVTNVLLQVVLGLAAAWWGLALSRPG